MWLQDHCRPIFTRRREENRRRLADKFHRLLNGKRKRNFLNETREVEEEHEGTRTVEERRGQGQGQNFQHRDNNEVTTRLETESATHVAPPTEARTLNVPQRNCSDGENHSRTSWFEPAFGR